VVNFSDEANVLHSPGLLEFATAAGLYDPALRHPFSYFDAFMTNNEGDQVRRDVGSVQCMHAVHVLGYRGQWRRQGKQWKLS